MVPIRLKEGGSNAALTRVVMADHVALFFLGLAGIAMLIEKG
ncbi:MAG: hypothetical protein RLN89_12735 [Parvibaculum sp.]